MANKFWDINFKYFQHTLVTLPLSFVLFIIKFNLLIFDPSSYKWLQHYFVTRKLDFLNLMCPH